MRYDRVFLEIIIRLICPFKLFAQMFLLFKFLFGFSTGHYDINDSVVKKREKINVDLDLLRSCLVLKRI